MAVALVKAAITFMRAGKSVTQMRMVTPETAARAAGGGAKAVAAGKDTAPAIAKSTANVPVATPRQMGAQQAARTRDAQKLETVGLDALHAKGTKTAKKQGITYSDGGGRYSASPKASYRVAQSRIRLENKVNAVKSGQSKTPNSARKASKKYV